MTDSKPYTVEQLANLFSVSEQTIRTQARLGELPHFTIGRRILFPKSAIDSLLNGDAND